MATVVDEDLQRLTEMLAEVLSLTEKVISDETRWHSTSEETSFLVRVSARSGQPLPLTAARSASVDLGFLAMAKFALEAALYQMTGTLSGAQLGSSSEWVETSRSAFVSVAVRSARDDDDRPEGQRKDAGLSPPAPG